MSWDRQVVPRTEDDLEKRPLAAKSEKDGIWWRDSTSGKCHAILQRVIMDIPSGKICKVDVSRGQGRDDFLFSNGDTETVDVANGGRLRGSICWVLQAEDEPFGAGFG